jgi:hypothetical protein
MQMKLIVVLSLPAIIALISLSTFSGPPLNYISGEYCAKLKDGRLVVIHDETIMTAEVSLKDGVRIKPDGTVMVKDSVRFVLQDGECVDENGKMLKRQ